MGIRQPLLSFLATGLLLGACATTPTFDTQGADQTFVPAEAVQRQGSLAGRSVAWGGVIIQSTNLQDRTRLEILAYPLDSANRPDTNASPTGRFLAERQGYLETVNYAPGRLVTVVGPLEGTRAGRIGETEYAYPVVEAQRIQLWRPTDQYYTEPRVYFGVGVGVLVD